MTVRQTILAAIAESFDQVKAESGYSGRIKSVQAWRDNVSSIPKTSTPLVYVVDTGRETVLVEDSTTLRIAAEIHFQAVVKTDYTPDTVEALNDIMADCKRFITSEPQIGNSVLRLRFVETGGIVLYPPEKLADCLLVARLRYTVARGAF